MAVPVRQSRFYSSLQEPICRQRRRELQIFRQMPGEACVALSKLYEHRFGDEKMALQYALKAKDYPDCEPPEQLEKRVMRLKRKMSEGDM